MNPVLSIIVPFLATHDRLMDCLNSIASQVSQPYEIMLIDDGNVGFDFGQIDALPFVSRLVHQRSMGPGAARNTGLEAANGDYIVFVDSDDELIADPCRHLAHTSFSDTIDIVTGQLIEQEATEPQKRQTSFVSSLAEMPDLIRHNAFTAHIYRRDFLKRHSIVFPSQGKSGEDAVFLSRALARARHILVTDLRFYHYKRHADGLSSQPFQLENFAIKMGALARAISDALRDHPSAHAIKMSILFKYGVREAQRALVSTDTKADQLATILADFQNEHGIATSEMNAQRLRQKLYWGPEWQQLTALLEAANWRAVEAVLRGSILPIYPSEKPR